MASSRIMWIEQKSGGSLKGQARIGRVLFSKTGRSIYYKDQKFQSLKGRGFKANYYDTKTLAHYWISGCKRNGGDALYTTTVEIDDDVSAEYWTDIRGLPERATSRSLTVSGKY
ncbi:MAG: 1-deoxy-D-xylulose-5-phosphate synthase [Gammaproteobacteria bacterium]|nr:1-deoxy-D-xylulose-5-phosphate synthase [Gammaproteobacteria bacterium]